MPQRERMLQEIGISSTADLFSDIPESIRLDGLDIPEGMGELEVIRRVRALARQNRMPRISFAGCGFHAHHVPSAVRNIVSRNEFLTSYTPYQAEVSQGLLQAMFEYQSLMSELTGMDVVNSSMYDMGSALGEAARMAYRIRKGDTLLVPEHIHAWKRMCLDAYLRGLRVRVRPLRIDPGTGMLDLASLREMVNGGVCGVYVETPNIYGCIETRLDEVRDTAKGTPLIVGVDPILLALMRPPGDHGADIVIGEGGTISTGMNFGGPLLGVFATSKQYARKMPGRLVGATRDLHGTRAYCLTLATREQHIRRGRATSNICSNEALCALASAVYLSLLGRDGLRDVASQCHRNAHTLCRGISSIEGFEAPVRSGEFFCEFTARVPSDARDVLARAAAAGVLGGVPLDRHVSGADPQELLVSSTEIHTPGDIEEYVSLLRRGVGDA